MALLNLLGVNSYSQVIMPMDVGGGTAPATPSSSITVPTNSCGDKTITRSGTPPAGVIWCWQTSASGTDMTYSSSSYTVTAEGTRTIYLRAHKPANGMWSTGNVSKSVTVNEYPAAPTTPSVNNQCGQTILTRANPPLTPAGNTWYWQGNASNGTSTTDFGGTYTVTSSDTYYIRGKSTANCWGNSTPVTVNVTPYTQPSVSISQQGSTICAGQSVTFTSSSPHTVTSYTWKKNGNTVSTTGPNFTTTQINNGDVLSLTVSVSGTCLSPSTATSNSLTINSVVQPSPVSVSITDPGPQCSFSETSFTATPTNGGSNPTYTWYRNGNIVVDNQITGNTNTYSPQYALQNGEKIKCLLTSNASGCISNNPAWSNEVTITMITAQTPVITVVPDKTSICEGESVTFTASTSHTVTGNITWSLGGIPQSTGTSFTITNFHNDVTYNVTASATVTGGCLTTNSVSTTYNATNITVNPRPIATASDQTICSGNQSAIVLSSNLSATSFTWSVTPSSGITGASGGSGTLPLTIQQTLTNSTASNGTVTYHITPSKAGCTGTTINTVVTVKPSIIPAVNITHGPSTICAGESITFTANSSQTITSYSWNINQGAEVSVSSSFTTNSLNANDVVYLTVGISAECQTTPTATANTSATLVVKPNPAATITPVGSTEICSTCQQAITASTGAGYAYTWKKDGVTISETTNSFTTNQPGAYLFEVSLNGCSVTSSTLILEKNEAPVVELGENRTFYLPANARNLEGVVYDPDGIITSYQWIKISGPNISMVNTTASTLTLNDLIEGTFVFRLTTTDNFGESVWDEIEIVVENPPNNYNWIKETVVSVEGISTQTQVDGLAIEDSEKIVNYTYFDGLGRPMQSVGVQGSPVARDFVQTVMYDELGREKKKYLPYVVNETNGYYKLNSVGNETELYSNSPQYQFYQEGNELASDSNPFSETIFEPSPLNRILEQGSPGLAWQPDATNTYSSADRTIKFAYESNSATDQVYVWSYTQPSGSYPLGLVDARDQGNLIYYEADQLYKTKTKDENYNEVIEFKDKEGKVILKKVQAPDSEWAETYYIYDDFDNLVTVIPPAAVKVLTTEYFSKSEAEKDDFLKRWAFRYDYDQRRRMIQKQVPGAESVYMVYDDRNRLVLTQDGNQRSANQWTFTKYDELNRPVLTGIYMDTQHIGLDNMQLAVADFYNPAVNPSNKFFEVRGTAFHDYTNQSFPSVNSEADYLTATYYDDYNFSPSPSLAYDNDELPGQADVEHKRVGGQMTGAKVKNLGDGSWLLTVNYYDDRYRVIQSVSQNHKEGTERVTSLYDFGGKVLFAKTTHQISGSAATSITRSFEYDHAGRLLETWHDLGSTPVLLAKNEYNELGQLITKKLHSEDGNNFQQNVNYSHNIRGWLTRINNSDLNTTADEGPKDYFGMELGYNTALGLGSFTPQYNGNISAAKWSVNLGLGVHDEELEISEPKEQGYVFVYDAMNRLEGAAHQEKSGSLWTATASFHEDNLSYDLNGNILSLSRTTKNGAAMDVLNYDYGKGTANHSNKLLSVTDSGNNEAGFVDGNTSGNDYDYDANGNMKFDKNKGIDGSGSNVISYNYLNLPERVQKTSTQYIDYVYDATGRKLQQNLTDGSTTKQTDYMGEFIYEDHVLQFINHEEGRAIPTGQAGVYEYQYHLKDHLGNVRVTFTTEEKIDQYTATMEPEHATEEEDDFPSYNSVTTSPVLMYNHTAEAGATTSVVLNGAANKQVGLAKSLKVVPGDIIDIEVYAKYFEPGTSGESVGTFVAGVMTAAFGLTPGGIGIEGASYDAITSMFNGGWMIGPDDWEDDDAPKAYLNYILFDEDFMPYDMGWDQIDISADAAQSGQHDQMTLQAKVRKSGFAYIYISNEDDEIVEVYFDDLEIMHRHSEVIQSEDYYPFGLTFNSYHRENSTPNKWKFQGQEHVDDLGLNWDSFKWRNHQPDIGRFFNIDPLSDKYYYNSPYAFSENRVINGVELEGMEFVPIEVITKGAVAIDKFLTEKGLNTDEKRAVMDNKIGAAKIYNDNNREIAEKFSNASGLPGPHNGPTDALRHSLFNALNTQSGGEEAAKALGDAHETGDTGQPENQKTMDLHNNSIGRQVALDNPNASPQELVKILLDKLANGELKVLNTDGDIVESTATKKQVKNAKESTEKLDNYGK